MKLVGIGVDDFLFERNSDKCHTCVLCRLSLLTTEPKVRKYQDEIESCICISLDVNVFVMLFSIYP